MGDNQTLSVTLTVNNLCKLEFIMISQGRYNHHLQRHQMNYLRINPPECYKCAICGLFGDFKSQQMRTCDGEGYIEYGGWLNAWDERGWSWERTYVEQNCNPDPTVPSPPNPNENKTVYIPPPDPGITDIHCDEAIQEAVLSKCNQTRIEFDFCCDSIGGTFCDDLQ